MSTDPITERLDWIETDTDMSDPNHEGMLAALREVVSYANSMEASTLFIPNEQTKNLITMNVAHLRSVIASALDVTL